MKVFEAVCLCRPLLESLERNGVDMSDIEYLDIYLEYRRRKEEGEKVTYTVLSISAVCPCCTVCPFISR